MSPAEDIASRTLVALTVHLFPAEPLVRILGGVECAIGLCFLFGFFLRTTLIVFFVHMFGTFTALVLCPGDCFSAGPLGLTLVGQYIMKNIVLVSAGVMLIPKAFINLDDAQTSTATPESISADEVISERELVTME